MATQLHELGAARQALAKQLTTDRRQVEAERKPAIRTWLEEVATKRAAARHEWLALATTAPSTAAPAAGLDVFPAVREQPEEPAEGAPAEEVQPEPVTEKPVSLDEQVFRFLADHPDGVPFPELQGHTGRSRIEVGAAGRRLIDAGRAEKRGQLYFAI